MYCWYLRHTYLREHLKKPGGKLTVCGEKVDLGAIEAPVFVYGARGPHRALDGGLRIDAMLKARPASCSAPAATSPA
jgi:poly(3-hydroxyalkanoate) synthetase